MWKLPALDQATPGGHRGAVGLHQFGQVQEPATARHCYRLAFARTLASRSTEVASKTRHPLPIRRAVSFPAFSRIRTYSGEQPSALATSPVLMICDSIAISFSLELLSERCYNGIENTGCLILSQTFQRKMARRTSSAALSCGSILPRAGQNRTGPKWNASGRAACAR